MDSRTGAAYPAPVIARLLLPALCLLPALAHAGDTTPTTGDGDGDTDTDADGSSETSTMPPEYEPCGCRSDQPGAGWALAGLVLITLRRRGR
jgi:MYXO-CTERM domain-containing protein